MLDGYTRLPYSKMGGLITSVPAALVPPGSALLAEDVDFTAKTVKTRPGLTEVFQSVVNESFNGLDALLRNIAATNSNPVIITISGVQYTAITQDLGAAIVSAVANSVTIFVNGVAAATTNLNFAGGILINGYPLNVLFGQGWLPGQLDALNAAGLTPPPVPATQVASNTPQTLIAFGSAGNLYKEDPAGTGVLTKILNLGLAGLYMQMTSAYDRAYMAFSDLITGQAQPFQYLQYQNQAYVDPLGVAPATITQGNAMVGTSFLAGAPGDIPTGTFYCVVLFMTRSGYISGIADGAYSAITVSQTGLQLSLSNIPLGPANTVARIIAFTEPGISSSGPFYYIPDSFTVAGLNGMVTSTIINDNVTTAVSLNFTSDALHSSTDVTTFFDKMLVPYVTGAKFLPSLKRIAYFGNTYEPSTVFFSEVDDPETLFGLTSRVFVAENNGQRIETVFEFYGEIYCAKERGGHVVTPNNTDPATWSVTERWNGVGPCGPRALDVCEEFVVFAHRSGAYRYEGGTPEWISWEHSGDDGLWKRINWQYAQLISVKIDTENKRIFFCVPFDQSTVPNKILVLDYKNGFGSPVVQDASSNLISGDGRKWAVWNIPAYQIVRIERTLTADANDNDKTEFSSQLLLASSVKDGAINMFDIGNPLDNGKGISARYKLAYQRRSGVLQLGGVDIQARGNGQLGITQVMDEDKAQVKTPLDLKAGKQTAYTVKTRGQSPMWSLLLSTVNEGDWWEIGEIALWVASIWAWNK